MTNQIVTDPTQVSTYKEKFNSAYLDICEIPRDEHKFYLDAQELRIKGKNDPNFQNVAKQFQDLSNKNYRRNSTEEYKYKLGLALLTLLTAYQKQKTLQEYFKEERDKIELSIEKK